MGSEMCIRDRDTREEEGKYLLECDLLMTDGESKRYVIGTALISLPSNSNI